MQHSNSLLPHVVQESDGHWRIDGVYVGLKIDDNLYAEPIASSRHLIRSLRGNMGFARRVGEVFGGHGDYQAVKMRGDHVGLAKSLVGAARLLDQLKTT